MSKAEKFIIDSINNYSNERRISVGKVGYWIKQPWLTPDQARKAVEIARAEIYDWLQKNADDYCINYIYTDAMIEALKRAMKDE